MFRAGCRPRREDEAVAVGRHVGMAVTLERTVGAAPQTHHRPFEEADRRIEVNRPLRRQVRRRRHGQLVARGMGIAAARYDCQVARLRPPLAHGHAGDLAHRQSVYDGNRQRADARLVFHVEHGAVDVRSVGIGTVQHHYRAAEIGAGIHHAQHRNIVGVETQTHVLHVDQQHVE